MPSTQTTKLRGPVRENWIMGQTKAVWGDPKSRDVLEDWAKEYGSVFYRPGFLGGGDLTVVDPKAVAHILDSAETTYHIHTISRIGLESLVGSGLISSDGESHKRQKKAISPGFTSVKIREYTQIFLDCAHKLASKWDDELENSNELVTDANKWFSAYSLDTIGLAGFEHDFGAISGHSSAVWSAFDGIANAKLSIMDGLIFILQPVFPFMSRISTDRQKALNEMHAACSDIARKIIVRTKVEERDERSIMGLLIKAESTNSRTPITEEEVTSQIRTLIVAGYETTTASLIWTLIELCRQPDLQRRLRAEVLAAFPGSDPTHDQLTNKLPLLDAVVHETLRLHPPVIETFRTAQHDNILPLSQPVTLPDGSVTDRVVVAKKTTVSIPIAVINRSKALWGEDAWEFRPDRWFEPLPAGALEISGYRHMTSFLDGPKVCLGRSFAVTNLKALLFVLMQRYAFELPGGPETRIELKPTIIYRPTVEGGEGLTVPIKVKRIE